MTKVIINELGISEALHRYLEQQGYKIHNLELRYEHNDKEFSALVDIEPTESAKQSEGRTRI